MGGELIRRTHEPHDVLRITLNRPAKRNAICRDVLGQLAAAVAAARHDSELRLLILAAEGPVFCAGMDLGEMQSRAGLAGREQLWLEDARLYANLLAELVQLRCPTLAVVQGPALAGGLGLVLACDIVVASANAWFALPEPKRGIVAAAVIPLLVHRLGAGRASYLLLSGQNISAAEAYKAGLCHELIVPDQLDRRVAELTESILTGSSGALAATKELLLATAAPDLGRRLEAAIEISAAARGTAEAREGLQAFLDKRPPAWSPEPPKPQNPNAPSVP